jgi:acyl transferase domain-containing protein
MNEPSDKMEDIAIVGVGCRFSGNATNPQELWSLLEAGESTWTKIPKSRFNHGGFYHPNPQRKGAVRFCLLSLSLEVV